MRTEATWAVDYNVKTGRVNASTAFLNYRFGLFTIGGGDAYLRGPGGALSSTHNVQGEGFNQYRLFFGSGPTRKRGFDGAPNFGVYPNLCVLQKSHTPHGHK